MMAVEAVPGRYAVAPPYLAGDAPVADIEHPVEVGVLPGLRDEPGPPVPYGLRGGGGKGFYSHEPLLGERGLNDGGAPVALPEHDLVGLHLFKEPESFKPLHDLFSRLVPVEPGEHASLLVHPGAKVHDLQSGQAVAGGGDEG